MDSHVVARFPDHDAADAAATALEQEFPQRVSVSTTTAHEEWGHHWFRSVLEAIGGAAAAASNLMPGFGVLFLGGPLDGVRQGAVMADWLSAHPVETADDGAHFLIVQVKDLEERNRAQALLIQHGGVDIHTSHA